MRACASHLIRYCVRPERAAENEELLRAVFAELVQVRPVGLVFTVLRLDDGVTFVDAIVTKRGEGRRTMLRLTALKAFHARLRERCVEGPTRAAATVVDTFGFDLPPDEIE